MKLTLTALSLFSLTFAALPAAAGTPLPNPPFTGGGFVAPTKDVLKQEEAVNKAIVNYIKRRTTCDRHAVNDLQLAYTSANDQKVPAIQAKWAACIQYVGAYYVRSRDRTLAKGTPGCLDQAGIDAQRAASDASIGSVASQVYCDGDGAAPDPGTGLNIPDKKQETIGETELAKVALKAQLYANKCYSKGAILALKLGGVFSQSDTDKIQACLDRANAYAADAIADLDQTQKLPACLSVAAAEAAVASAVSFSESSTDAIYCAE